MTLILSGNVTSATAAGYEVANSCIFDRGSSAYMHKTPGSSGSQTTWTISAWVKRVSEHGTNSYILDCGAGNGTSLYFGPAQIEFWDYQSGAYTGRLTTNAVYRDHSAWYHIVAVWDTTNGTAGDRMKLYVNGTEVTSFATDTNPSSSQASILNSTTKITVGSQGTSIYASLYMAEVCFIDGQALTPTSFGEFDEDSPTIWKPKDVSGLTFGTNGFYLDFEDSSNLGNAADGSTDLTEVNLAATDSATDTPTNNFCTLNPLAFENAGGTGRMSEGNLRLDGGSSTAHNLSVGTIAVNQGKWWFEAEIDALGGDYPQIGIRSVDVNNELGSYVGQVTGGAGYASHGTIAVDGSNVSTGLTSYSAGDIISVGLDLDNNKIYWYINGSLANSGGTSITNRYYTFSVSQYSNSGHWLCNFGASAPYTISSGNADDNGYGNFEHAPVSGYLSLCTKNLAEEG